MYEQIIYEVEDPVATITLNRPEALNSWTMRMAAEVRHAVAAAQNDPAVVGIIITGAGRGFCAGADMQMLTSISSGGDDLTVDIPAELQSEPGDPDFGDDFRGTYTYLMSVPKPVIAAINGAIAGMAIPIALSCDLRFMARDAVFLTAFAQRGLVAEWGLSWLLPRLVGPAVAMDLLFSSRRIDGEEAARLGVVNAAVPPGETLAFAKQYVIDMSARCSPTSLARMKRQINQQTHAGLGAAEAESVELMGQTFKEPDFAEGVSSFLEKRPPAFPRIPAR
jgi:enoyl-CoA hydratase/carnithine racemase